ncbi:MAG: glutathione-dependent formaldehyde dehydrogenase [Kofleriaceae bacterium]|nr:MAG: glutathione-dependent formaldehyde dehydrogenase [Kofleriaceae bacterium]MBZ0234661.1 glutathione-dependent formaldehyde dehydrogenase [Kofleriaceae bacterium]
MRALTWHGKQDVRVEDVPDPAIVNPHDAVVRVTSTAICGSDLHLYNGFIPAMKPGDVIGHEFMGEIVEVGPECHTLVPGDRVLVICGISCGRCWFCQHDLWSACDNTNPASSARAVELAYGHSGAALFGYSHLFGGYAGGQAEYVRVPFADVGCVKVPVELGDEQVLFLGDIVPTGWMAAENCGITGEDTVAVFGCGPVGQMAIRSALVLGAARVIAIDSVPERLLMAEAGGATVIDEAGGDVARQLDVLTGGRGPDACIDAVGLEAHGEGAVGLYDKVKQTLRMQTDRPTALRTAIMACRKGGTISIPGVYGGFVDKFPIGAAFGKGLTFKMGQTHFHRYARRLLPYVENGAMDPSFVITHRVSLADLPDAYRMFNEKRDGCIKVVARL